MTRRPISDDLASGWHVVYEDGDQALVSICDDLGHQVALELTEQAARHIVRLHRVMISLGRSASR